MSNWRRPAAVPLFCVVDGAGPYRWERGLRGHILVRHAGLDQREQTLLMDRSRQEAKPLPKPGE
jgi:hypothetical protein